MKYLVRNTLSILILLLTPGLAKCDWFAGGAVNSFIINGNLYVKKVVPEYEVFFNYSNNFGAIYSFGLSSYNPKLEKNDDLKSLRITNGWLMRCVRIPIWRFDTVLAIGFGCAVLKMKKVNNREVIFGALSLRSDFELLILKSSGFEIMTGITYRGCPVHSTGLYSDRFGFKISISG